MIDDILLDVSTYDRPTFNAQCLYDSGVRNIIFGVFSRVNPPDELRKMAHEWRAVGGNVLGFYGLVYFGGVDYYVMRDTKWAVQLAKEFNCKNVFIDVENDAVDIGVASAIRPQPVQRQRELRQAVEYVEDNGLQPWIYTYQSFWVNQMGNTREFSNYPLWFARYGIGGNPTNPIKNVFFGGWNECYIHQYTSTLVRCNRNRDHNYWFKDIEGDDDLSAEQYNELKEYIERLIENTYGSEEAMSELEKRDVLSLADRIGRIEAQDGWLDKRLDSLEEEIKEVTNEPPHYHTGGEAVYE